jgi:hypothetical protein
LQSSTTATTTLIQLRNGVRRTKLVVYRKRKRIERIKLTGEGFIVLSGRIADASKKTKDDLPH